MAESKSYGQLPDIDTSNPETFETPEPKQVLLVEQIVTDNPDVDTQRLDPQAREVFDKPVYEGQETLRARYTRLCEQVEELISEAETEKDTDLHQLAVQLHNRLLNAKQTPQFEFNKWKLVNGIKEYTREQPEKQSDAPGNLVYHLEYNPRIAAQQDVEKLAKYEARIARLEKLVGIYDNDGGCPSSSLLLKAGSISAAIDKIDRHVALLSDPVAMEKAQEKYKQMCAHYTRMIELRQELTPQLPPDTLNKIDQLYDTMKTLEPVQAVVPQLIARFKTLQSVHAQQVEYKEFLKSQVKEQENLEKTIETLQKGQEELRKSIVENTQRMLQNLELSTMKR